jgi:hypothetical protein
VPSTNNDTTEKDKIMQHNRAPVICTGFPSLSSALINIRLKFRVSPGYSRCMKNQLTLDIQFCDRLNLRLPLKVKLPLLRYEGI